MALSTTTQINSGISWSQIDLGSINRVSDIGSVAANVSLLEGSGNGQNNLIWHSIETLPSGSSISFDLSSLQKQIFDNSVNMAFQNVKGISIKNNSTILNHNISVSASTVGGLSEIFHGNSGAEIVIYPQCAQVFSNVMAGWTISNTNKILQVNDISGLSGDFSIAIVGCSGSSI